MKKLLLILLCVPLIFSCGENKVEDEIKKFGSIEKETLQPMIKTYACQEYKFTLINTSFNKSIQFTLERECTITLIYKKCIRFVTYLFCYTNKEQEDFRNKIDNTKQMIPFNGEKDNYFVTLFFSGSRTILNKKAFFLQKIDRQMYGKMGVSVTNLIDGHI